MNKQGMIWEFNEDMEDALDDELQIQEDWDFVLSQVRELNPDLIDYLKATPIHFIPDLDCAANFTFSHENVEEPFCLNVSEKYFELTIPVAIGVLLHELGHAMIAVKYLLNGDVEGYLSYCNDNEGHNMAWWNLVHKLETYFGEDVTVKETLTLDDPSIYEYPDDFEDDEDDFELFESKRLTEADKSRFINKVWPQVEANQTDVMHDVDDALGEDDLRLPEKDDIISFVNSGAADKYKIDWNKFNSSDNDTLWTTTVNLIASFFMHIKNKALKSDPKSQFSDSKMFKILKDTDNWLFVGVLNYEGAKYCDSFKCGGAGAQWCIGYREDNSYWMDYAHRKSSRFVLAYNKKIYADPREQKYMIQLRVSGQDLEIRTWNQKDEPENTLDMSDTVEKFSITSEDLNNWYSDLTVSLTDNWTTTFSLADTQKHQDIRLLTDSTIVLKENDVPGLNFEYSKMIQNISTDRRYRIYELLQSGTGTLELGNVRMVPRGTIERQIMEDSHFRPSLHFEKYDNVHIKSLWISYNSPLISFEGCNRVQIDCLYMPRPDFGQEDYRRYAESGDFKGAIRENGCEILFGKGEIDIKQIKIMPCGLFSVMDVKAVKPDNDLRVSVNLDDLLAEIPYQTKSLTSHTIHLNLSGIEEETNAPATDFANQTFYINKAVKWNDFTKRIVVYNAPEEWTITCTDPNMSTPTIEVFGTLRKK